MITEYILGKKQIKWINRQQGGSLRSDAEIETALEVGKGKAVYRNIAYLWRAILVGHPFTDGNKRTALAVALLVLERCNVEVSEEGKEKMVEETIKIAKENITNVARIERLIRYAVTGD